MSRDLRDSILRWYLANRRRLPWRETRDPYAIWVSEVMLQQTRVETVVAYYERFLRTFPTVRALAKARESDVLASWSGLGYYRRARNLHAAAQLVAREHAGRLPQDLPTLRALPGIGEYTAAAIASVAFGRAAAAVDGNVIRVLSRIHGLRGTRTSLRLRRAVLERAERMAQGPRPGDWTQALMELGATVCLPREPLCGRCPASRRCAARRAGTPDRYPEPAAAVKPRAGRRLLLLARDGRRVFLVTDPDDSHATWTLPYASLDAHRPARAARALSRRYWDTDYQPEGPRAIFRHRTFSHDWTYEVWSLSVGLAGFSEARGRPPERAARAASAAQAGSAVWVGERRVHRLPVRAHTLKALKRAWK